MRTTKNREFLIAGVICLIFVLGQVAQRIVFFTVPLGSGELAELQSLGHPLHILRSFLILCSIILLLYPFLVFARFGRSDLMQMLIVMFYFSFVLFEMGYRSVELVLVQLNWSAEATYSTPAPDLLSKFILFKEVKEAIYFPLLLSHGAASALTAWSVPFRGLDRILKVALLVNVLRLAMRIAGMVVGVQWMNTLTAIYYFPFILLVFVPITGWCFLRSQTVKSDKELHTNLTQRNTH